MKSSWRSWDLWVCFQQVMNQFQFQFLDGLIHMPQDPQDPQGPCWGWKHRHSRHMARWRKTQSFWMLAYGSALICFSLQWKTTWFVSKTVIDHATPCNTMQHWSSAQIRSHVFKMGSVHFVHCKESHLLSAWQQWWVRREGSAQDAGYEEHLASPAAAWHCDVLFKPQP